MIEWHVERFVFNRTWLAVAVDAGDRLHRAAGEGGHEIPKLRVRRVRIL